MPTGRDSRRAFAAAAIGAALLVLAAQASVRLPEAIAPPPCTPPASPDDRLKQARDRVSLAESQHGPLSEESAQALADEGFLLWGLERFAEGLPIAERALSIRLAPPAETLERAESRYQVADFRRATGDYAGALADYREAIAIWSRVAGDHGAGIADAWHYMGIVHGLIGDLDGARACLVRELALRERRLGGSDVGNTLQALADLATRSGDPAAEGLFARAQAIWERRLGPDDPFVARSLLARARLRAAAGDLAAARPLLERALSIRQAAFGPKNHLVAQARLARAELLARAGDTSAALAEAAAAVAILQEHFGPVHPHVAAALVEQSRLQWIAGRRSDAVVTALAAERMARERFLQSSRDLDDGLALRFAASRLSGLDLLLTALADPAPDVEPKAAAREGFDAVIHARGMVLDATASRAAGDPGFAEIAAAIPPGDALVSYARYMQLRGAGEAPDAAYIAFVLRPGRAAPEAVPLGPAGPLEDAVAAWRREVTRDPHVVAERDPDEAARAAGERLRRAIWDPIAPAVASARQVFVVPDAAIHLVSLGALPDGRDRWLVESGPLIHGLTAERHLVSMTRRVAENTGRGADILSIGGPDFDAAPAAKGRDAARPLCPEFAALAFAPLRNASQEAREVIAGFPGAGEAAALWGPEATAAAFAAGAPGRRILHLATHAFVLPERCAFLPEPGAAADLAVVPAERVLLRSGLAFAGANRRAQEADATGPRDDGILTAEEIAGLDLSGVDWVVLSGCDTGLGDIRAGEGVVGLRSAFERAGARTVIMSLWGAADASSRAFMRALYEARASGATTPEAMRRAALDVLGFQRARGQTTHPYYWGGFVASGDWR
jgi:CHAT domain-containing protein/tetratricopeptide (TPR) repeat protein